MLVPIRTRRAFAALSRSRDRHRSGPIRVIRTTPIEADDRPLEPGGHDDVEVGYAVGRRVGGAVVRNRLRRRLRVLMAELHRSGALSPGRYLVSAEPDAAELSFEALRAHVHDALGVGPASEPRRSRSRGLS